MTMTDPVADMLTRIRNANTAMHDDVRMPASKLKESLADVLKKRATSLVSKLLRTLMAPDGS